jgi:hypothetical protein
MASKRSSIKQTGLGPVRNTSILGGLIPPKLTPVRRTSGPRTPKASARPNYGPSLGTRGNRR